MSLRNSQNEFVGANRRLVSLRSMAVLVVGVLAWQAGVSDAAAQATSALSTPVVTPGGSSAVTVTGTPGHYFALVGSTTGAGFSYAGVQFAVGPDVVILAMGNLDGNGQAVVNVVPPFVGSSLDRYYIQAVTSTVPNFVPLQVAPGNVVVNGDLAGLAAAGLAGPAGPTGPAGAQGPAGPAGASGAAGAPGPTGPQGPAGAVGAVGPVGPTGAAGPQGPAGNDGAAGATGAQGPAGADGAAGPAGPQGPAGADGAAGPQGPQGPAGNDGAAGPQGPQGPAGNDGAAGPQGPQGPAGNDGAPGAVGPQGPAGADGAAGAAGPQGPAGAQGPAGNDGALGPIGPAGAQGPQGIQGPQGPQGIQGVPGSIANVVVRTAAATATSVTVLCNAGEVTFGGGGSAASVANNQTIIASIPVSGATVGTAVPATNGGSANGWRVTANVSLSLTAYVICGS